MRPPSLRYSYGNYSRIDDADMGVWGTWVNNQFVIGRDLGLQEPAMGRNFRISPASVNTITLQIIPFLEEITHRSRKGLENTLKHGARSGKWAGVRSIHVSG